MLLAAHAAIAIENARLHERSRELSIVEERNRLARELHDSVTQQLFGVVLAAESAGELLARGDAAAGEQLERVQELARGAMEELRSVVFELRPASLEAEGLGQVAAQARRRAAARVGGARSSCASPRRRRSAPTRPAQVFRIAQEALQNALRHAGAERIEVRLEDGGGRLALSVADDGRGFDADGARGPRPPARADVDGGARGRSWAGGWRSTSRPGEGTTVRLEVAGVIRVLIADDHAVVRQGLRTYLELQEDVEVVARGRRRRGGGRARPRGSRPTSCCSTSRCRGSTASRALPRLRERVPGARVIVLTSFGEDDRLFAALRGGAAGFLLKDTEPADLVRAIRTAHAGQSPLSPAVGDARGRAAGAGGGRPRALDLLTPRELEVLRLIARGRSNKRIALELGRGGEDGQDARRPRARQARAHRPHAGGAVRGPRGTRQGC